MNGNKQTNKKISIMKNLTLAYSSCPNDTFIFHALVHKLIGVQNISKHQDSYNDLLDFKVAIADVETLNKNAEKSIFDITKLSFATLGTLRDKYALLRTGAALGRGCGPLVVSMHDKSFDLFDKKKIKEKEIIAAVPGKGTTAFVLFSLFIKENFPKSAPIFIPMPFEQIMPAVKNGIADFGLVIHEGRFVYQNMGLKSLVDLGDWWETKTGLPIPLGCITVKRSICKDYPKIAHNIETLIRQSIEYAFNNPKAGIGYIKQHAQELNDSVIAQHINLYVNDFSKDIGKEGEAAICEFFKRAETAGLIAPSNKDLFAGC